MKQLEREIRICGQGWSSGHRLRQVDHRQQVLEEVLATVVVVIGVDDDDWWRCVNVATVWNIPLLQHYLTLLQAAIHSVKLHFFLSDLCSSKK